MSALLCIAVGPLYHNGDHIPLSGPAPATSRGYWLEEFHTKFSWPDCAVEPKRLGGYPAWAKVDCARAPHAKHNKTNKSLVMGNLLGGRTHTIGYDKAVPRSVHGASTGSVDSNQNQRNIHVMGIILRSLRF